MRNFARINTLSKHIPVVTLSMIFLLILCFIFQSKLGATEGSGHSLSKLASLFSISSETVRSGHLARLITANLFHVNRGHLLSNIVGLMFFSSILETIVGKSRVTIIILLSALGGTMGSLLFHMVDWMVGSSTILFGVYGGLGVFILTYRRELTHHLISGVVSWCIGLVLMATLGYLSLSHVDQGAHVGGLMVGILSTWILIHPYSINEINNPPKLQVWAMMIVLVTVFVAGFIKEVVVLFPMLA